MTASSFCDSFIDNMIHGFNSFESNYNMSYSKNTFYSYRTPICKYRKTDDNKHLFSVVDRDQSPSTTTTKHMSKLVYCIEKASRDNPNIVIETVNTFKEERPNV